MSVKNNPVQRSIDDFEPAGDVSRAEYISEVVRLPGQWELPDKCDRLAVTGFCSNAHIQFGSESNCERRDCPQHWYLWRREAVEKLVARIAAYRDAQTGSEKRAVHAVFSPRQNQRWTLERFWKVRREAYEQAGEHGCGGGVFVPHPYVPTDEAKAEFKGAVTSGEWEAEKGLWRFLREQREGWEELVDDLEVRPHGHMLGQWPCLDGEKLEEELPEGCVLHNVRSLAPLFVEPEEVDTYYLLDDNHKIEKTRKEVVREGFEDMAGLAMYLLSHASVQPGGGEGLTRRNTVTYFGGVHPNSFDPSDALGEERWKEIQRLAAEATGAEYQEESNGTEEPGQTCSREECEAVVEPVGELGEYLSDVHEYEGWFDSLPFDRQCEIWGLWQSTSDRPPPGRETQLPGADEAAHHLPPGGFERSPEQAHEVTTSRERLLKWYRRFGRQRLHRKPGHTRADANG